MDHCASGLQSLARPFWSHTWTFHQAAMPESSGLPRYAMWMESDDAVLPLSHRSPGLAGNAATDEATNKRNPRRGEAPPVWARNAATDEATNTRYADWRKPRACGSTGVRTQLRRGSVTSIPCGLMR